MLFASLICQRVLEFAISCLSVNYMKNNRILCNIGHQLKTSHATAQCLKQDSTADCHFSMHEGRPCKRDGLWNQAPGYQRYGGECKKRVFGAENQYFRQKLLYILQNLSRCKRHPPARHQASLTRL